MEMEIEICLLPEPWINRRIGDKVLREDKTLWLESWKRK